MLFFQQKASYSLLPDSELPDSSEQSLSSGRSRRFRILLLVLILFFVAVGTLFLVLPIPHSGPGLCTQPRFRREWRTLNLEEKLSYISAAQCLTTTPSPYHKSDNASIHDELALLHGKIGNYSHNAAPFLPWHRYYVHVYEQALREHCNYQGTVPYWDWSQDYQDLSRSPIWDITDGFGPGGDNDAPESVAGGHCVVSGPFAGLTPTFFEGIRDPHCLSRGMLDEATVKRVGNLTVQPAVLDRLVRTNESYFDFLLDLEHKSHLVIPYILQGDFSKVTAPNDPVFYLHHAQIDRVWWSWQQLSESRQVEYNGLSRNDSSVEGALRDLLDFGDFVPTWPSVEDVMNTESGLLCYRYDTAAWREESEIAI